MNLCIKSDFKDFYDDACSNNGILYKRFLSECMQRGKALRYLQDIGVRTIQLNQVSSISRFDTEKVVVYTDIMKHESKGKSIMTLDEAREMYPNHLASIYYSNTNGITLKYLQIGVKRFRLWYKKDIESLDKGTLYNIEILEDYNSRAINLPIYSIDYIITSDGALATDLNEVQNLEKINMQNYISSDEVVKQILNFYTNSIIK